MKSGIISRFRLFSRRYARLRGWFGGTRRGFPAVAGSAVVTGLVFVAAFGAVLSGGSAATENRPIVVFAAASMKNALEEITGTWQAESGHEAVVSFAGSSLLARQILQGAPADLYISANPRWMDEAEQAGRLVAGTRHDLVSNRLVLISTGKNAGNFQLDQDFDLASRLEGGKLAMALTDAVPAGQYAKAALEKLGIWQSVAPHVVEADNVRAALYFVAAGEAPFGIVYASDANAEPRVSVAATFPVSSHPPIRYPVAMLKQADRARALSLLDYLTGEKAAGVFLKHGFYPLPGRDS
ncbi:molybdate ABC transporter substrate-binding protein [Salaquimonas pukyongi]|uniref:molybdate ABC transporter substrate-binding protein n=1 Tax=Salaquimonas pukyongi TaxID=2712698 RepID=UPI0009FA476B|nr:molybdate ABC transporter substrate-binding protein [Salaquimonas pukyongi]